MSELRSLDVGDTCEYGDCGSEAQFLTYSRKSGKVMKTCSYHDDIVIDKGSPEYTHCCENCGCSSPIN